MLMPAPARTPWWRAHSGAVLLSGLVTLTALVSLLMRRHVHPPDPEDRGTSAPALTQEWFTVMAAVGL